MSILSQYTDYEWRIERFIFHVVQHGKEEPILLNETPVGEHEEFFLDRVAETAKGNRFSFNNSSLTRKLLKQIEKDLTYFVPNSKKLAERFHSSKDNRIKPGVFILVLLKSKDITLFSIIKYDHEKVLRYSLDEAGKKAILEEISNSFTKSKKSLHKSAIIELSDMGGELLISDRKVNIDISDFFKDFLDIKRKYTAKERTTTIIEVMVETVKHHQRQLPKEITSKIKTVLIPDAIEKLENFDEEDFFRRVLGPHGSDKIYTYYKKALAKRDLVGESFKFDKTVAKRKGPKRYSTEEGIQIKIPETATDLCKIKEGDSHNRTVITIETTKLIEEQ